MLRIKPWSSGRAGSSFNCWTEPSLQFWAAFLPCTSILFPDVSCRFYCLYLSFPLTLPAAPAHGRPVPIAESSLVWGLTGVDGPREPGLQQLPYGWSTADGTDTHPAWVSRKGTRATTDVQPGASGFLLARISPFSNLVASLGPGLLTFSMVAIKKLPVLPTGAPQGQEQLLAFHPPTPQHPVVTTTHALEMATRP